MRLFDKIAIVTMHVVVQINVTAQIILLSEIIPTTRSLSIAWLSGIMVLTVMIKSSGSRAAVGLIRHRIGALELLMKHAGGICWPWDCICGYGADKFGFERFRMKRHLFCVQQF